MLILGQLFVADVILVGLLLSLLMLFMRSKIIRKG